jgi:hypothetical protein
MASRPVFHAAEPFFLSGGSQIAIAKQRRGVGMKRIEARNESKPFLSRFAFGRDPQWWISTDAKDSGNWPRSTTSITW